MPTTLDPNNPGGGGSDILGRISVDTSQLKKNAGDVGQTAEQMAKSVLEANKKIADDYKQLVKERLAGLQQIAALQKDLDRANGQVSKQVASDQANAAKQAAAEQVNAAKQVSAEQRRAAQERINEVKQLAILQRDNDRAEAAAAKQRQRDAEADTQQMAVVGGANTNPTLGRLRAASRNDITYTGNIIRQLPSIQIPGLGIGTDQIANILRISGIIDKLGVSIGTLGPVAAFAALAVLQVVEAMKRLDEIKELVRKSAQQAVDAQKQVYAALGSGSTTKDAEESLAKTRQVNASLQAEYRKLEGEQAAHFKALSEQFGGDAAARARQATGLDPVGDAISERLKGIASDDLPTAQRGIDVWTDAIHANIFAANDAAEAEKKLTEERRAAIDAAIAAAHQQIAFATQTPDQLRKTQTDLGNTIAVDTLALNQVDPADTEKIKQLNDEITASATALGLIANTFLPIAQHADDVVQAQKLQAASASSLSSLLDKTTEDFNSLSAVISGLQQTGAATPETLQALNAELARDAKLVQELTAKYIPLAQAREADAASLKAAAEAEKKIIDLLADSRQQEARQAEDRRIAAARDQQNFDANQAKEAADFNLNQQQAEDNYNTDRAKRIRDYNEQVADMDAEAVKKKTDDQKKFDTTEADEKVKHNDRLAKIQSDANDKIADAAAHLDAQAVFEARRDRDKAVTEEDKQYAEDEKKRRDEYKAQTADLAANLADAKAKKKRDFDEQLADQAAQYNTQHQRAQADFAARQKQEDAAHTLAQQRQAADYALQDARRQADLQTKINGLAAESNLSALYLAYWKDTLGQARVAFTDFVNGISGGAKTLNFMGTSIPANPAFSRALKPTTPAAPASGGYRVSSLPPALNSQAGLDAWLKTMGYKFGTDNVPKTGLYGLHAGEGVLTPGVNTMLKAALGGAYTQPQVARAISNGFGGSTIIQAPVTIVAGSGDPEAIMAHVEKHMESVAKGVVRRVFQ